MANEFGGNVYDFENLTDDEIRTIVLEQLQENTNLDIEDIDVLVKNGLVTISGRVGTDAEVQVVTAVLDDILNLENFHNDLTVDVLRRGEAPIASDDGALRDEEEDDLHSEAMDQQSDTAEHLVADLESETFGTADPTQSIRDASAYSPPDRPVSGGYGSREEH